ncbi:hypothetical protein P3S67_003351 [Capsicum chacoense]
MNYSLHGIISENYLRRAPGHVSLSIIDGLLFCKKYSAVSLAATDSVVSPKCDGWRIADNRCHVYAPALWISGNSSSGCW